MQWFNGIEEIVLQIYSLYLFALEAGLRETLEKDEWLDRGLGSVLALRRATYSFILWSFEMEFPYWQIRWFSFVAVNWHDKGKEITSLNKFYAALVNSFGLDIRRCDFLGKEIG